MRTLFAASCLLAMAGSRLAAQTQINLRTQARQVDFSAASATKPFKSGIVLPVACSTGEAFFKTDAPAGQNLYGCTATNTWTLQAGWISGSTTSSYGVSFSNQTLVRVTGATHGMTSADLVVNCYDAGTPVVYVEADTVSIDPVSFDVTIRFASPQSGRCVISGAGGTANLMGALGVRSQSALNGSATLDFPSLNAGACSSDLTFTVPGAEVSDTIAAGWPADLPQGVVGTMRVTAAGTVAVRLCNLSGSSIDPPASLYRGTIQHATY